jgi:DNA-binding transcriptional ArsR family regulator
MKRVLDPDARLMQGAADPSRLAILRLLAAASGEVCACDFTACCEIAQPTVSHHLKVLRESGWVASERRGSWVYYRLRQDAIERFRALAGEIEGFGGLATAPGVTAGAELGGAPGARRPLPVLGANV